MAWLGMAWGPSAGWPVSGSVWLAGWPFLSSWTVAAGRALGVTHRSTPGWRAQNPLEAYTYSEHAAETTVAKYSPSGFYIASADVTGKVGSLTIMAAAAASRADGKPAQVRIWDTTNAEHLLKYEYRPISGAIRDLAWTDDSKRLVVAGEGSEVFARAFLWDSGSSVGEIAGHSKRINSVDVRQQRPYRVVTASEDTDVGVYAGPPFKLQHLNHEHARFVNCVRYAPDGNFFLSAGADAKVP